MMINAGQSLYSAVALNMRTPKSCGLRSLTKREPWSASSVMQLRVITVEVIGKSIGLVAHGGSWVGVRLLF